MNEKPPYLPPIARVRRGLALALAAVTLALPGAAAAQEPPPSNDSVVFIRDGNVWLASADGSGQYQVTEGGGFRTPSMSDDGTIVALDRDAFIVRMRQNGEVLSRFAVAGSGANSGDLEGPFDPQISPDGTQIAYWFIQRSRRFDPDCNCERIETNTHVTTTAPDAYTNPAGRRAGAYRGPGWIGSHRLFVADGAQLATYVAGADNDGLQRWYNDFQNAYAIAHAEITRDLSKHVVAHGDVVTLPSRLLLYSTNGQPWTDDGPPYDSFDPNRPSPPPPTRRCAFDPAQRISGPSWSSNGAMLTWSQSEGVMVALVPASLEDCAQIRGGVLIPGASDPRFSPAPIDPGARPRNPGGPPAGGGGDAAPRISRASLRPTAFTARRGTRLRMTLRSRARITFRVLRGRRQVARDTAELGAGRHSLRLVIRGLRPGRHTLQISARNGAGSHSVRLRFRVRSARGSSAPHDTVRFVEVSQ